MLKTMWHLIQLPFAVAALGLAIVGLVITQLLMAALGGDPDTRWMDATMRSLRSED